ncbi:MAG: class I SAM-dependent methyltransferase [Campylobacterota bacterium]|nr:class I SAM-dependent methyltransferase [Campylobacterota bacterium]
MRECKICESNTAPINDVKTDKIYHKCLKCEYIFLEEKFCINVTDEKKHYDNHNNNLESLGYVKMFEDLIEEFVTPEASEIKTALDFGCGEGEVLPILLERHGICCDRYDLFYFPKKVYVDKKYDLIVSTEVFEHLSEPLKVLKNLLSHLNKDGYLLLMTCFHSSDNEKFLKWFYIKDATHIGFFSIKTFEYLAKELNLKIIKHNSKNIIMLQKMT